MTVDVVARARARVLSDTTLVCVVCVVCVVCALGCVSGGQEARVDGGASSDLGGVFIFDRGPGVTWGDDRGHQGGGYDVGTAGFDVPPRADVPSGFGGGFVDLSAMLDGMPSAFLTTPTMAQGEDPNPTVGLIADVDGDGVSEVLFAPTSDGPEGRTTVVYDYDRARGVLALRGALAAGSVHDRLDVMAVVDLDGDGAAELVFNRPEAEVAWGLGGGRFSDPSAMVTRTGQWQQSYQALMIDDLDDDGWLDAMMGVANCCTTCREMKVFIRTGTRSFADRTDLLDDAPPGSAYALLTARMNGERLMFSIGQPCGGQDSPAFYRMRGRGPEGLPRFAPFDPIPPRAFIRATDPESDSAMRPISRWVPMGTTVGDADGDGNIDVAISLNFYLGLFRNPGGFPFEDHTAQFGTRPSLSDSGARMIPWGIALVDLDQDGRLDLFAAHGNDHSAYVDPMYFVGPQRATFYWNAGEMSFGEVGDGVGIERRGQWRSLSVDDLDDDGDADLVVGAHEANPRVYRNEINRGFHGFSLRFRGTTSNPLGIGATVRVTVRQGQPEKVFVVGTVGSPLVMSRPVVFVGLGTDTRAERVRVTWPSGLVQDVMGLTAGSSHTIVEPQTVALTPTSRHVRADGQSTVTVRITPRDATGALRTGARVEARVVNGMGTLSAVRRVTDGWECTVTSPRSPGSSVIEVSIDGVAVGVRPRVWWD